MNFLKKALTTAAVKTVKDIAMVGAAHYVEQKASADKPVSKSKETHKLTIKKKSTANRHHFIVFDETGKKKYVAKADLFSFGFPCIRLYNTDEREVGKVELASKTGMGKYSLYIRGHHFDTLARKKSVRIRFDFDLTGWQLEGNSMQTEFVVTDKSGDIVLNFYSRFATPIDYILDVSKKKHVELGLLLVMAVELALSKK